MYYIWIIPRRQFTENIISLRLFIGLIICLALFVSSTYVLMEDYEKRLSVHNAAEIEHRNALEAVKVYSHLKTEVAKPPEPLSVICLGIERQLGSIDLLATDWRGRPVFSPLYFCFLHTWVVHLLPNKNLIGQSRPTPFDLGMLCSVYSEDRRIVGKSVDQTP